MSDQTINQDGIQTSNPSGVDYQKIIDTFNCSPMTDELLEKVAKLSHDGKVNHFLERKIIFAHRDFDKLVEECLQQGENDFYLYTGRGPSSNSLHIGHLIPFVVTKHLQDMFDVPVVIQLTDDEKYLQDKTGKPLTTFWDYAISNIKDILACQFNPDKTFVFINSQSSHLMASAVIELGKRINYNQLHKTFGVTPETNIGSINFPIFQMAPAFASTFPSLFSSEVSANHLEQWRNDPVSYLRVTRRLNQKKCLIVAGAEQDNYFRLLRDNAVQMGKLKPAVVYLKLLSSLKGKHEKMTASVPQSAIYLSDPPKKITSKINGSFSGGQETVELHRQFGGNVDVDVAFQYLTFLYIDSDDLEKFRKGYQSGEMLSGELKNFTAKLIIKILEIHAEKRKTITPDVLKHYMTPRLII